MGNLSHTTSVEGLDDLYKVLIEMPKQVGKKGLADGVKAGGRVIRDEARILAPRSKSGKKGKYAHPPGLLRKSIRVQKLPQKSKKTITARIGVFPKAKGGRFGVGEAFYAYFVELGTYGRAGVRYLSRASEIKETETLKAFKKAVAATIGKELAKAKFK